MRRLRIKEILVFYGCGPGSVECSGERSLNMGDGITSVVKSITKILQFAFFMSHGPSAVKAKGQWV